MTPEAAKAISREFYKQNFAPVSQKLADHIIDEFLPPDVE